MTSVVKSEGLLKRGLLLPLSPPALPMLPVPDDGDSRLPWRAKVVLGLGITEEDFTPSVLGAEADLPPALAPNNLKEKQITTSVVLRKLISTFNMKGSVHRAKGAWMCPATKHLLSLC